MNPLSNLSSQNALNSQLVLDSVRTTEKLNTPSAQPYVDPFKGKIEAKKKRVQSAVVSKANNRNRQGPTSFMMESALTYQPQQNVISKSDLDKLRNRMGKYVHSLPSERKMDHR